MNIKQQKNQKRQQVKEIQERLHKMSMEQTDHAICSNICTLAAYQSADTVFCFVGTALEINTVPLLERVLQDHKRLVVPKCVEKGVMYGYEIRSFQDLEAGSYGIQEPKAHCKQVPKEEIDFAVVPCLACDREGNRLGHGGGYYDRYLENTSMETAVICREALLMSFIPKEAHDRKMDWVVTEHEVIKASTE